MGTDLLSEAPSYILSGPISDWFSWKNVHVKICLPNGHFFVCEKSIKSRSRARPVWDANLTSCVGRDFVVVVVALRRVGVAGRTGKTTWTSSSPLHRPTSKAANPAVCEPLADGAAGQDPRTDPQRPARDPRAATNWSRWEGRVETGTFYLPFRPRGIFYLRRNLRTSSTDYLPRGGPPLLPALSPPPRRRLCLLRAPDRASLGGTAPETDLPPRPERLEQLVDQWPIKGGRTCWVLILS